MTKKKEVQESNEEKQFKVKCLECDHINPIPIARFYDGFDGSFTCAKCTYDLDMANHVSED